MSSSDRAPDAVVAEGEPIIVGEHYVIECEQQLSAEQIVQAASAFKSITGKKALVLSGGMKIARDQDARLARIEQMLELLLITIAEIGDDDDGRPTHDLDGKRIERGARHDEL